MNAKMFLIKICYLVQRLSKLFEHSRIVLGTFQSVLVENVSKKCLHLRVFLLKLFQKMFVKTFQSVPLEKIFTQNVNKKLIFQNCLETFQGVWKHLEMNRLTTWSRQIWSWTKLFYQINAAGWRQWRNLLTPFPENETTGQMALKWYVVCLWSRSIRLIRGNTTYESKMVESGTRQTTDYDLSLLSAIGRGLIQLLKKHSAKNEFYSLMCYHLTLLVWSAI